MKILYLTSSHFPSRSAHAVQIQTMCSSFADLGHRVTLTGFGRAEGRRGYRGALLPAPPDRFRLRLAAWLSRWRCRLARPHVAYTREAILGLAAARAGTAVVFEPHSLPRPGSRNDRALAVLLRHPALRRVVPISQALLDDLIACYGAPGRTTDALVAHDGAEAGPEPAPPSGHRPISIGYFGHLYAGKGMELIAEVARLAPQLHFEIYGGQAADIRRWTEHLQGVANVRLHGHIPHEQVRQRMEGCDVLLAPYAARVDDVSGRDISRWMSPLKVFEYMAAGRAIMASDLPVLREVLTDRVNALLCPPGDPNAWAASLARLQEEPALRLALGATARQDLVTKFTWADRAARVLGGLVPLNSLG